MCWLEPSSFQHIFYWVPGLIPEPAPSRIPWLQGKDMQAHSNADSSVKVLGLGSEARLPEWGELVSQAVLEVKVGLAGLKHPSCKWTFPQRMIGWRILKTGYFKFRVFFFFLNFSKVKNWNLCIEYRISEMWVFDHDLKAVTDSFQGAKEKHVIVFSFSSHQILAVNARKMCLNSSFHFSVLFALCSTVWGSFA